MEKTNKHTSVNQSKQQDSFVQAFLKSGSSLQYRIASILKNKDWEVKLEQAYMDDTESKVRQCDIVAVKPVMPQCDIKIKLVIECKYVKDGHIIFLKDGAEHYCSKREDRSKSIQTENPAIRNYFVQEIYHNEHHYFEPVCISHACMLPDKEHGFRVSEDVIYKAISQVIKPIIDHGKNENMNTVSYPIVVIGGAELHTCLIAALPRLELSQNTINTIEATDRLCMESSYVVSKGEKPLTFTIDILKEDNFEEYLAEIIQPEVEALIKFNDEETMKKEMQKMRNKRSDGYDVYAPI